MIINYSWFDIRRPAMEVITCEFPGTEWSPPMREQFLRFSGLPPLFAAFFDEVLATEPVRDVRLPDRWERGALMHIVDVPYRYIGQTWDEAARLFVRGDVGWWRLAIAIDWVNCRLARAERRLYHRLATMGLVRQPQTYEWCDLRGLRWLGAWRRARRSGRFIRDMAALGIEVRHDA